MTNFERWDVVAVPFPYVERLQAKRRPALIVSGRRWLQAHNLLWVVMITSAANRSWADDVTIDDLRVAGLPVASVIRPSKIATVEAKRCERLGRISQSLQRQVQAIFELGLV